MSHYRDTITPEERAHRLLHNPTYHGDPDSVGMEQFISLMEGAISSAIMEAEARGEAREMEACAEVCGALNKSLTAAVGSGTSSSYYSSYYRGYATGLLEAAEDIRSRKPIEASGAEDTAEGYNGA